MAAAKNDKSSKKELHLTRIYDAPVKAVWDAWTDPEQAAKWWGPRGFTITTHAKDLRPGGFWSYTMHGPDGIDYPNKTVYLEVEKYSRLVYDHGGSDDRPALFRVTVRFTDLKGRTKMEMTMAMPTVEAFEQTKVVIKKHGGNSTWDRLGEYLAKEATGKERFIINRSFEAPLATMYDMWTDPRHLAKWLPPTGAELTFVRADIRPGGTSFYCMTGGPAKMWGRTSYLELRKPDRLVYTQEFCDEHEKPARHPMAPAWPATMLTVVTLAEEGPNQTRVTVTWEPAAGSAREEIETFVKARAGMSQGWTGSFDKLEEHLLTLA